MSMIKRYLKSRTSAPVAAPTSPGPRRKLYAVVAVPRTDDAPVLVLAEDPDDAQARAYLVRPELAGDQPHPECDVYEIGGAWLRLTSNQRYRKFAAGHGFPVTSRY